MKNDGKYNELNIEYIMKNDGKSYKTKVSIGKIIFPVFPKDTRPLLYQTTILL